MLENPMLRLLYSPCDDEKTDRSKESGVQGTRYCIAGKGKAAVSTLSLMSLHVMVR